MMGSLCLLFLLSCWMSESAATAVLNTNTTSEAVDWTENGNETRNYNTHTVPLVCQLSTCELLLNELGAMQEKMRAMETRLQASETHLVVATGIMEAKLQASETKIMAVETRLQASETNLGTMEAKLQAYKNEIEDLKEENGAKPKVAFAAALGDEGRVGRISVEYTLPFKKILTNIGSAYNPSTGVFIVPVKGVYFLSFTSFGPGNTGTNSCMSLFKNDQRLLSACDTNSKDSTDSAGNGATLLLEKGDHVYITLHSGNIVYDDHHNRSCFSGFLLFQM